MGRTAASSSRKRRNPATVQEGAKSLTPTSAVRVAEIQRLLIQGTPPAAIREHCRDSYGLGPRQTQRLLACARRGLVADWEEVDRTQALAEVLSQLAEIHQKAMAGNNLSVALGCVSRKAALMGLDPLPDAKAAAAVREAMARVVEAIDTAGLGPDQRLALRLGLASRGLCAMPDLQRLPDAQLERIAAGELLPASEPH